MGDGPRGIKVFSDHFEASTSSMDYIQTNTSSISHQTTDDPLRSNSSTWARRKLRSAVAMLNLFGLRGLPWGSGNDQEKVVLSAAEVESLRAGLAELEERDAYLKAQLEHVDEILRSACLSGYLYIRTRWAALPGEPPPLDDTEVDDWLPRFLVLHGSCIFFYLLSTVLEYDPNIIARFGALGRIFSYIDDIKEDLSPQDSTLLSDVTEVGPLPCFTREDGETRYCFYILTHHGLRFECSSASKVQVDSWLRSLQTDCEVGPNRAASADSGEP